MPCTLTGSLEGDRAYAARQREKKTERELDKVTRYLCAVLTELEANEIIDDHMFVRCSERNADGIEQFEILDWWASHKKSDLAREKRKKKNG